jgi:hypothetical protein
MLRGHGVIPPWTTTEDCAGDSGGRVVILPLGVDVALALALAPSTGQKG